MANKQTKLPEDVEKRLAKKISSHTNNGDLWGEIYPALGLFQDLCKFLNREISIAKEEGKKEIVKLVEDWYKTHPVNEDTAWNIQNLLGNILGWETEEQKKISKLFDLPGRTNDRPKETTRSNCVY